MSTARVDVWVWVLIYGGLVLIALGLSVQRSSATLGWALAAAGFVLAAIGAVLVWVRSRMKDSNQGTPP